MQDPSQAGKRRWLVALGVALGLGLAYALLTRFVFARPDFNASGLLSGGFLLAMPVAMGAISAYLTPREAGFFRKALLVPCVITLFFLLVVTTVKLEGAICVIIIAVPFVLLSLVGALLYLGIASLVRRRRDRNALVVAFALLPYLLTPLENRLEIADSFHRVENNIEIAAPAPVVWQHIIRVAPIRAADLDHRIIDDIGFPRPVEATLSHEGLGGVRHATFERGVEFIETVDDWQPLQRLGFSIVPNTATIPPTTFDEHVTIGGPYFDVLHGTYELHPLGPGRTRLVLHSQQRVSTHVNWYAALWTSYVMSEIQGRILNVLKRRCETAAAKA